MAFEHPKNIGHIGDCLPACQLGGRKLLTGWQALKVVHKYNHDSTLLLDPYVKGKLYAH
jgi:hypothetical protein